MMSFDLKTRAFQWIRKHKLLIWVISALFTILGLNTVVQRAVHRSLLEGPEISVAGYADGSPIIRIRGPGFHSGDPIRVIIHEEDLHIYLMDIERLFIIYYLQECVRSCISDSSLDALDGDAVLSRLHREWKGIESKLGYGTTSIPLTFVISNSSDPSAIASVSADFIWYTNKGIWTSSVDLSGPFPMAIGTGKSETATILVPAPILRGLVLVQFGQLVEQGQT